MYPEFTLTALGGLLESVHLGQGSVDLLNCLSSMGTKGDLHCDPTEWSWGGGLLVLTVDP